MIETLRRQLFKVTKRGRDLVRLPARLDRLETLLARTLAAQGRIGDAEWGLSSQNGEDSVLAALSNTLADHHHFFVEIGIGRYEECNSRMLCLAHGWRGVAFDLPEMVRKIDVDGYFRAHHPVKFRGHVVDEHNVAELVRRDVPHAQRIGLLSIDIDGQDYWVLRALLEGLDDVPLAVMVEYNAHFGATDAATVPRDAAAHRFTLSSTGLVFGASLPAFEALLAEHGYELAYVERSGSNALFVQPDVAAGLPRSWQSDRSFKASVVRQARNGTGGIILDASAAEVAALVADCPVVLLADDGPRHVRMRDVATDFSAYW